MKKIIPFLLALLSGCAVAFGADLTSNQNGYATDAIWGGTNINNGDGLSSIANNVTFSTGADYSLTYMRSRAARGNDTATAVDIKFLAGSNITLGTTGTGWWVGAYSNWSNAATYGSGNLANYIVDGGNITLKNNGGSAYLIVAQATNNGETLGHAMATLSINSGTVLNEGYIALSSATNNSSYTTTASGTLNLNGGTLYVLSARGDKQVGIRLAAGNGGVENGVFNWNGGNLAVSRQVESLSNTGSGNLIFANYNTANGTFAKAGGTTALYSNNRANFSSALTYTQGAGASMTVNIQNAASYDRLEWYDHVSTSTVGGNTVDLAAGTTIYLSLTDDFAMVEGQTINIVVADIILIDGQIASDSNIDLINFIVNGGEALFDASIGTVGGRQAIILEYAGIPEPAASAALLGLLAVAAVARRKR